LEFYKNKKDPDLLPEIRIDDKIKNLFPNLQLGIFTTGVSVSESGPRILGKIDEITSKIRSSCSIEDISSIAAIQQTKNAYRKLGKDPSRYRPSAEALCRRIVNGKSLFKINNVVDILNTISIEIGYSIGGYDLDKINGNIVLSKGLPYVSYDAIGRGLLNIEDLPVLFDETGPFGCPTSDSTRTMVTTSTKNFLMIIFDFEGSGNMNDLLNLSADYYSSLAGVNDIKTRIFKVGS
jgi:DNA/RNA-binding domain of Phe-tRNA-synthetase-like protein